MAEWYYAKDGEKRGPVSTPQLQQLAATGELQPDDQIWRDGLDGWAKASQAKGLFEDSESQPPFRSNSPADMASARTDENSTVSERKRKGKIQLAVKSAIASTGSLALVLIFILVCVSLPLLFIVGGVAVGEKMLPWLMRLSVWALGFAIIVLTPLALISRTRRWAGIGFFISSYVFGLTGWFMGLLLTWMLWGSLAVFIGLFILGIGVVPIAMLATLFDGMWAELGLLFMAVILTFGFRTLGMTLEENAQGNLTGKKLLWVVIAIVCVSIMGFGLYSGINNLTESTSVTKCRKAAEQGDAKAQRNLGYMYAEGDGVPKDDAQAAKWYRKAAEQGLAEAQGMLGIMYANGRGVQKDDTQAVEWYRKAAEQGLAEAQAMLGVMYADGRGVQKDDAQAFKWHRKAAEQGLAEAQHTLGFMYANGLGVRQNSARAVKWLRKSAAQGNTEARNVLKANGLRWD